MVKLVRDSLRGIFGSTKMTELEFTTALKLAQMKINSRPLVGVSDDPRDNNLLTITPFHLKMAKPVAVFPSSIDNLTASDLDKIKLSIQDRFQKRKVLQAKFFIKWRDEYLMSLAKNKNNENKNINVGDIVIILNERKTRDTWPIARVTKVFRSRDGVIRSVELKLPIKIETKKKTTKKNALLSDHRSLDVEASNRYTTRGVEHIAILESVDSQPQESQDDKQRNDLQDIDLDDNSLLDC